MYIHVMYMYVNVQTCLYMFVQCMYSVCTLPLYSFHESGVLAYQMDTLHIQVHMLYILYSSMYVHNTYLSVHGHSSTDMFIILNVCTWFTLVHPWFTLGISHFMVHTLLNSVQQMTACVQTLTDTVLKKYPRKATHLPGQFLGCIYLY